MRSLLVALCWNGASYAVAPAPGAVEGPAAQITQITLERDCNGCASGSLLMLHRDGRAIHTDTGKARLGTEDRISTGQVSAADFEQLARVALAQGFFELDDVYEDPAIQDGRWATLIVTRRGADKRVFRRDDAGPTGLKSFEAAVEAVQSRIAFSPAAR